MGLIAMATENENLESEGSPSGSGQEMREWKVIKTVTEYHTFIIEADSLQEAHDKADSNDMGGCYCDSSCADDTFVQVQSVKEVK